MLGSRTALCVALGVLTSCFSQDRPLNGGGAGEAGTGAASNGDAGERSGVGGSPIAGSGGSAGSGLGEAGDANPGSGGSTSGSAGSSAGSGGSSAGSGGSSAGQAGAPPVPVGSPCTSSDGLGCPPGQFCVDLVHDSCDPDGASDCAGLCAEPAPRADLTTTCSGGDCPNQFVCVEDPLASGRNMCTGLSACDAATVCPEGFVCGSEGNCTPDKVACVGDVLCPAIVPPCPAGLTHSIVDECFGPCVPLESCGCASDSDCVDGAASCDRVTGRCVIPKSPEPRCALPFETGPCLAYGEVFAFVDGQCQPAVYGGCDGNDNRFSSLEECRSRCEGQPTPNGCPEGSELARICLSCGPTDGCAEWQTLCARTCDEDTPCEGYFGCYEGLCSARCL
jgi:hypothetical protein